MTALFARKLCSALVPAALGLLSASAVAQTAPAAPQADQGVTKPAPNPDAEKLPAYHHSFQTLEAQLKDHFVRDGYCYAPYGPTTNYGIAVHSENYIQKMMTGLFGGRMELVRFKARGWAKHQDVWSYRKVTS